jgi:hypothetical protein
MSNIPINSGTGPGVAVDLVGTDNYQIVKIMQSALGATGTLGSTLAISGTVSALTATVGTNFNAYVLATTSAAGGIIVKTSGANTIYITDILVAVPTAMNVSVCSETTVLGQVFLAANGGFVQDYVRPLVCNSAQSLRVILSSSGTCAVTVCGYVV